MSPSIIDSDLVKIILAVIGLVGAIVTITRVAVSSQASLMRSLQNSQTELMEKVLNQNAAREIAAREFQEKMALIMSNHLSTLATAQGVIAERLAQVGESLDQISTRLLDEAFGQRYLKRRRSVKRVQGE